MSFVIAQRGIDGHSGEVLSQQFHQPIDDVDVLLLAGRPHVVRDQITRPQDVIRILHIKQSNNQTNHQRILTVTRKNFQKPNLT